MQSNITKLSIGSCQDNLRASSWVQLVIDFLAVLLFYTCVTILFFSGVMHQLEFSLIGPPEDNMQDLWNSWYASTHKGYDFFYTNMIKFPEGTTLYYEAFAYPMVVVARILTSLVGTEVPTLLILQNSLLLASFPLAGTGAFYLVRYLIGNTPAALLGGFIFAFNPSHVAQVMHHAAVSSIEFIPFFILFYLKALQGRRALDIGAAVLFYLLSALSFWYYLFYICFFIAFHTAYCSFRNRAWPKGWDFICPSITLGATAILLLPLSIPMLMEAAQGKVVYAGGHNSPC